MPADLGDLVQPRITDPRVDRVGRFVVGEGDHLLEQRARDGVERHVLAAQAGEAPRRAASTSKCSRKRTGGPARSPPSFHPARSPRTRRPRLRDSAIRSRVVGGVLGRPRSPASASFRPSARPFDPAGSSARHARPGSPRRRCNRAPEQDTARHRHREAERDAPRPVAVRTSQPLRFSSCSKVTAYVARMRRKKRLSDEERVVGWPAGSGADRDRRRHLGRALARGEGPRDEAVGRRDARRRAARRHPRRPARGLARLGAHAKAASPLAPAVGADRLRRRRRARVRAPRRPRRRRRGRGPSRPRQPPGPATAVGAWLVSRLRERKY